MHAWIVGPRIMGACECACCVRLHAATIYGGHIGHILCGSELSGHDDYYCSVYYKSNAINWEALRIANNGQPNIGFYKSFVVMKSFSEI